MLIWRLKKRASPISFYTKQLWKTLPKIWREALVQSNETNLQSMVKGFSQVRATQAITDEVGRLAGVFEGVFGNLQDVGNAQRTGNTTIKLI